MVVVCDSGFDPDSLRFQRSAFTRLAYRTKLERAAGNDPASVRWRRTALPLSYGRMVGIPWIEHGMFRRTKVLQTLSVTRLGDTHLVAGAGFAPAHEAGELLNCSTPTLGG